MLEAEMREWVYVHSIGGGILGTRASIGTSAFED